MRRTAIIASAASFLLFVLVALLWARSYWVYDLVAHEAYSGLGTELISVSGRVVFYHFNSYMDSPPAQEWAFVPIPADSRQGLSLWREFDFSSAPHFWTRMGFRAVSRPQFGPGTSLVIVAVPHWSLALLLLVAPAFMGSIAARKRRRLVAERCVKCGYDLRGSPERCPECGLVPTPNRVRPLANRAGTSRKVQKRWWAAAAIGLLLLVSGITVVLVHASEREPAFVGGVYRDASVRGDQLIRFVSVESAPTRKGVRRDLYLLEWDLSRWDGTNPVVAAVATKVGSESAESWQDCGVYHSLGGRLFITWKEPKLGRTGSLVLQQTSSSSAQSKRFISDLGPLPCAKWGGAVFDRSNQLIIAGGKNGGMFRANTLDRVRPLPQSDAWQSFLAARPDELDNTNCRCFLSDDGRYLTRAATIYRPADNANSVNYQVAVIYDFKDDRTRDVPLEIGLRTDIADVECVRGTMWFYLCIVDAPNHWSQLITDESRNQTYKVEPDSQADESMLWDITRDRLIRVHGYPANPQSLPLTSGVDIYEYRLGKALHCRLSYSDGKVQLPFFDAANPE
jgi:hypothetical protein